MLENIVAYVLGGLAFLCSVMYFILIFVRKIGKIRLVGKRKLLTVSVLLLSSIWLWRVATLSSPRSETILVECMMNSLKTFTLDAEYAKFVVPCRQFIESLGWIPAWTHKAFAAYFTVLYLAAPVTGATVVLEIITSACSRVKLFLVTKCMWRKIFYFSELNDESYALAKSILKNPEYKWYNKPILVFTDVYVDNEEEKSSEIFLSARNLGAICLKDDILHLKIRKGGKKTVFLIDADEEKNIRNLASMASEQSRHILDGAEILLFAHENSFALVGYNIREALDKKTWKAGKPRIMTVNGYNNMVKNVMKQIPLYEPLVGQVSLKEDEPFDLNVTIIGAGEIGTEMFLEAYWYGQILNCQLNINVLSQETEGEFIDKINFINSEIFSTAERVKCPEQPSDRLDKLFCQNGTTKEFVKLMRLHPGKTNTAQPYFRFRYYQTNIKDDDLAHKLSAKLWDDDFTLLDTDYFVVSLGSDTDNLTIAELLKKYIGIARFQQNASKNTVIAYAMYSSELSNILNQQRSFKEGRSKIYMHAFGSFEEVFDTENIYMKKEEKRIKDYQNAYDSIEQISADAEYDKARGQYDFWANVARSLHLRYKVFSSGLVQASVFNCNSMAERDARNNEAFKKYYQKVQMVAKGSPEADDSDRRLYDRLLWIEHRRWCAFMRTNGFACPEKFETYYAHTKSHKDMELKLHPCLVESKCGPVQAIFDADFDKSKLDCLDDVSVRIAAVRNSTGKTNYKVFDGPEFSFNDYNGVDELML